MYRRTALATSARVAALRRHASSGVWSNFKDRSPSLQIQDAELKKGVLNKIDPNVGPASLPTYQRKLAYHSPIDIDETFAMAYEILEKESEAAYKVIKSLQEQVETKLQQGEEVGLLEKELESRLAAAEETNPEVMYNVEFTNPDHLDMSQPVYRKLLREKWQDYSLLVTMQRLEQLHVIPDTLPTLDPKAEVKVKFTHNADPEFNQWVVPGSFLPAFAASKPPTIRIQEFDKVEGDASLYSVLLVNPDTPDLARNSFSTTLHYGLHNVPLNNVDNTIDVAKLLKIGPKITFQEFLPLTPEKNAPAQRACLWVFRQRRKIGPIENSATFFDIRKFAEENELTAVGAHVWRQKFDRSVAKVREEYGLGKATVFHRVRGLAPLAA
ncbi:uncharacterized protein LODBEIA_P46120 [Lodderomyces beijingensis]|uniref:PEBP-like protein n=1 Tax=Lodderomyces beijingensis TaxID=1775926 RepID=A0ABP0ZQG3_9ASCO